VIKISKVSLREFNKTIFLALAIAMILSMILTNTLSNSWNDSFVYSLIICGFLFITIYYLFIRAFNKAYERQNPDKKAEVDN